MSDLLAALGGGAIGSLITLGTTQVGRSLAARREVEQHDAEARERNEQFVIWVDDATQDLVREFASITEEFNRRNAHYSSGHRSELARTKATALHRYRDEEWRARQFIAELRAAEGGWHWLWRKKLDSPSPTLSVDQAVQPFLERWREPITRGAQGRDDYARVLDRTTRSTTEAVAELQKLPLT
jgi:hypothetical protein